MIGFLTYLQIFFLFVVYPGLAGTYAEGGIGTVEFFLSAAIAALLQYISCKELEKQILKRV